MSERDGWNHLYLFDADDRRPSRTRSPTANGSCAASTASTTRSGRSGSAPAASDPDQDPYYVHYCRVNFDGSGLTVLTEGDGTHEIEFSPDRRVLHRPLLARRPAAGHRAAPRRRRLARLRAGAGRLARRCVATGWQAAGAVRRQGPRRDRPTSTASSTGRRTSTRRRSIRSSSRSTPGRRALRPQGVPRRSTARSRWPNWGSSSCRSTAWAPNCGPRRSTTSAGRTSATPASPTASSGSRRRRSSIP